jgi:hypothetical protein
MIIGACAMPALGAAKIAAAAIARSIFRIGVPPRICYCPQTYIVADCFYAGQPPTKVAFIRFSGKPALPLWARVRGR